jgi:hypothetical protein
MNLKHYKAASEHTDEAERALIPPFTHKTPYDHDKEAEESLHAELKHLRKLREELPQMRKENQRLTGFIQDAAAYVRWAFNEGHRQDVILSNLVHDLRGLANDEPCFSPRVTGYASREREGKLT